MPAFAIEFEAAVDAAIALARAGEIARVEAAVNTNTYREFRPSRLEALYELSYIRVFIEWERFVEETFVRMMCDYQSPVWTPAYVHGAAPFATLAAAKAALYGGQDYLLWWNPIRIVDRSQIWFANGPHETVASANVTRLSWFAAVRHRIAHGSSQVRLQLDQATMGLAGRRYRGASAGRFLRDWEPNVQPPRRWLVAVAGELVSLAKQISP